MNIVLEQFSLNRAGRDFVVGDIHGCFHLLEQALDAHHFNPATDRCFAVGDLIDRGPHSDRLLHWLRQPWFHTCLGNHEEMLLYTAPESPEGRQWFNANGGKWWLNMSGKKRNEIRAELCHRPIAIEVQTHDGRVGIVHADIPASLSWQGFIQALQQGDTATQREAQWGRRRMKGLINRPVAGIDHVVCGHTITPHRQVMTINNVWFIDTGACLESSDSRLTLLPLETLFQKSPPELASAPVIALSDA